MNKLEKIKARIIEKHGDVYDLTMLEYVKYRDKMTLICPIHGQFKKNMDKLMCGEGCQKCGYENGAKEQSFNTEKVVSQFIKVHGNRYGYNNVNYRGNREKVNVMCESHGLFSVAPYNHKQGKGCPKCAKNIRYTTEEIVNKFIDVHGDSSYDYSLVEYVEKHTKVKIKCIRCANIFLQTPNSHTQGNGCPSCAPYGFNQLKNGIVYYLKVNDGDAYKIGITNRTINERFRPKDLKKIEVLKIWEYENGKDAYNHELNILREFKYALRKGNNLLESGNSELFDRDILNLDYRQRS